jgi:hypothetical protein
MLYLRTRASVRAAIFDNIVQGALPPFLTSEAYKNYGLDVVVLKNDHVLWLFSSAACVLVSILAFQIVWRKLRLEYFASLGTVLRDLSSDIARQNQTDLVSCLLILNRLRV